MPARLGPLFSCHIFMPGHPIIPCHFHIMSLHAKSSLTLSPCCIWIYAIPCHILILFYVVCELESEETVDPSLLVNKDGTSLIDTIADSDQVVSVINDTADHVLKLSFTDSSPVNQSSHRRYLF